MHDPEKKIITIRALSVKSMSIVGFAIGLLSGLFSLALLVYFLSNSPAAPQWVELNSIMVSIKRAHPVANELIYAWPAIAAIGNALGFAVIGVVYNLIALRAPIKISVSIS